MAEDRMMHENDTNMGIQGDISLNVKASGEDKIRKLQEEINKLSSVMKELSKAKKTFEKDIAEIEAIAAKKRNFVTAKLDELRYNEMYNDTKSNYDAVQNAKVKNSILKLNEMLYNANDEAIREIKKKYFGKVREPELDEYQFSGLWASPKFSRSGFSEEEGIQIAKKLLNTRQSNGSYVYNTFLDKTRMSQEEIKDFLEPDKGAFDFLKLPYELVERFKDTLWGDFEGKDNLYNKYMNYYTGKPYNPQLGWSANDIEQVRRITGGREITAEMLYQETIGDLNEKNYNTKKPYDDEIDRLAYEIRSKEKAIESEEIRRKTAEIWNTPFYSDYKDILDRQKEMKQVHCLQQNFYNSIEFLEELNKKIEETNNFNKKKLQAYSSQAFQHFSSAIQDISQEIHLDSMWIRNLASTIYSVRNLPNFIKPMMDNSDFLNAQAYRMQRYDTNNRSRQSLIDELYKVSQEGRVGLEESSTLATRILATGVTNGDASSALRLASLMNKASFLGGSTQSESRSALLQLSQGLAANQLGGDELRAIRESGIGITEMLAKGLTKAYEQGLLNDPEFANVQIVDLKELGKKAKLTAKTVITAFDVMEDEINEQFKEMPQMFGQTLSKLANTFQKRMYDLNTEGKGLARITKMFENLEKWLDSEQGVKALDTIIETADKFIETMAGIVSLFASITEKLSGFLPFLASAIPMLMAGKSLGGILFGKTIFTETGTKVTSGFFGAGGIGKIIDNFVKGGKLGSFANYSSKWEMVNGKPEEVFTHLHTGLLQSFGQVIIAGLARVFPEAFGKAITTGGLLPAITPILPVLVGIAAVVGGIYAISKAQESARNKAYEDYLNRVENYDKFTNLTEESKKRFDVKKREWYDRHTNDKGIFGVQRLYDESDLEKWNNELYDMYAKQDVLDYEAKQLEQLKGINENTKSELQLTDDFINSIKDMRTRSFRGELLMGTMGISNNAYNVTVNYTGDVADFKDKVINAVNEAVEESANRRVA